MALRIAIDASAAAKRERTGVARYATCLLDALIAAAPADEFVLGLRLSRFRRHRFRYRTAARNVRTRYFSDGLARLCLGSIDLFHGLDARIPEHASCPTVVTLHDVGPALDAGIAKAEFRARKLAAYQTIARRAHRIICVSAATRDGFRRLFDVPEERFRVIHHGLEPRFRRPPAAAIESALAVLGVEPPYLLFVGLLSARKNCTALVRAFDRIADRAPGLQLVLAGGRAHGFDRIERDIAAARARDRIVLPGFVADDLLPALYAGAHACVLPSRVEGFGIPLLEAMACGTPVLAADTPVAREVAGNSALLVDTDDDDALAAGLARLWTDRSLLADLRDRGATHARGFTWEAAARQTIEVYRDVVTAPAAPARGRDS